MNICITIRYFMVHQLVFLLLIRTHFDLNRIIDPVQITIIYNNENKYFVYCIIPN
jgi:hypothetical protein